MLLGLIVGIAIGAPLGFAAAVLAQPRLRRLLLGVRRDVRRAKLAGATASGLFVFGELAEKNTGETPAVEPEPEPQCVYDWQQEDAIQPVRLYGEIPNRRIKL